MTASGHSVTRSQISIVVPAYNEARNLPVLYQELSRTLAWLDWEWIVVDDHSSDDTFKVMSGLARQDNRVGVIRLARNHGSFTAVQCGLQHATGQCAVVLAADLQDPPQTIPALIEKWEEGAQVVWASRDRREGESWTTRALARAYYWIMRRVVGIRELPPRGADFFLLDRAVLDALGEFKEQNVSVIPLLTWMGFRQASIGYDKKARLHGESGWNLQKKLKLFVDSITSFSYKPIRLMSYLGFLVSLCGFVFAAVVIFEAFFGAPVAGYPSLMVAILVIGGLQMMMLGVLGEYLWRALDESRGRPRFLIEQMVNRPSADGNAEPSRSPPERTAHAVSSRS